MEPMQLMLIGDHYAAALSVPALNGLAYAGKEWNGQNLGLWSLMRDC